MRIIVFWALLIILNASCSPYSKHLKQLEADYLSGTISAVQYHGIKTGMLQAEGEWRSNVAAGVAAGANSFNQSMANQEAINAYNYRTQVIAQPRSVYHYGTVNHNHFGTINHNVNVRRVGSTSYLRGF
jgi:hypothetical protein